MLSTDQKSFLLKAYQAAIVSGHIFPGVAAAEAALESAWGTSKLARMANNLFGLKKPQNWTGPVIDIPTREYLNEKWVTVPATWPVFPTWVESFTSRMETLRRVPRYAVSLAATTPEDFAIEVSSKWATDPDRAANVLSIYRNHRDILKS